LSPILNLIHSSFFWYSKLQGGRYDRDRGRDENYRDRRGPPGGYGRGPPDDYRRGGYDDRGRDDYGPHRGGPRGRPPPHFDPYYDGPPGPRGGDSYGPPRGRGGPPPNFRGGGRDRRRRDENIPGISLLVRNIGPHITNHDLQAAFGRIGDVRDVYIPRDYHSQQAKGFAFIEYADPDRKYPHCVKSIVYVSVFAALLLIAFPLHYFEFFISEAREARDEMDRFRIKGCELEVVFAQERRKSPNEMRGRVVNQQNAGGRGRERSSSFERHQKQRRRDEGRRNRDDKDGNGKSRSSPDRNSDEGSVDKSRKERGKSPDGKDGDD